MKKLACIAVALFVLSLASPVYAASRAMLVHIDLRASLRDAVYACSDIDFPYSDAGRAQALSFGAEVRDALGVPQAVIDYDDVETPNCVNVRPENPLSRAGPQPRQRVFEIDTAPLEAVARRQGYDVLQVDVCLPALPDQVLDPGNAVEGDECDHKGFRIVGSGRFRVAFRATLGSLLAGVTEFAGFIVVLLLVVAGLLWFMNRRGRWAWFARRPRIAWSLVATFIAVVSFAWVIWAMYLSSLVPSAQMFTGLAGSVDLLLVGAPVLAFAAFAVWLPMRRTEALAEEHPELVPDRPLEARSDMPPLYEDADLPSRRGFMLVQMLPLGLAMVLLQVPLPVPAAAIIGLTAALLFLVGGPLLEDRIVLRANYAQPASDAERRLLDELRPLGLRDRLYVSQRPVAGLREANLGRAALFGVSAVGSKVIVVWDRLLRFPPAVVAGGVVDSIGFSVTSLTTGFLVMAPATIMADERRWLIPGWVFIVLAIAVGVQFAGPVYRRTRVFRAVTASDRAAELLLGFLLCRRLEARLMSSGETSTRRFARHFRSFEPASQYWNRSLRLARRLAKRAGLSDRFDAMAAEAIRAADSEQR